MDLYYSERDAYINNIAMSKALCVDKLRHEECKRHECQYCEKQKLWSSCIEGLDDYSRLLLNDKIDMFAKNLAIENPTSKEIAERIESEWEIRKKAVIQCRKEVNWEWLHSGGNLFNVILFFLVPIIIPIILTGEWFL